VNPQNNRVLVTLLCAGLGIGALLLFYNLFWGPLQEYNRRIEELAKANDEKEAVIMQIVRDQKKLRAWRWLSLPGVENLRKVKGVPPNPAEDRKSAFAWARNRYSEYLSDLLKSHGVAYDVSPQSEPQQPDRNIPEVGAGIPVYTALRFRVEGRGKLANIVKMLEDFQTTPLLHRIRNLTIKQAGGTGAKASASEPLTVSLVIEALIVNGAQKRGDNLYAEPPMTIAGGLLAVPRQPGAGLALLPWYKFYAAAVRAPKRTYTDIALKNIFEGKPPYYQPPPPPPPDIARATPDLLTYAYLTDVTIVTSTDTEILPSMRATVYYRNSEQAIKLRKLPGWNSIPLLKSGELSTVAWGQVVRIDTRGVVFRVKVFARDPAEEPEKLRFKKADAIYSLYKTDVEALVKAKVIRTEDAPYTFKVPVNYWEGMIRDKVVRERSGRFSFQYDLIRGQVLKHADSSNFVLIRLDERYCSFQDNEKELGPVRPHYGYCRLPVGENVTTGLLTPLNDSEVRELQQRVAQAP
jgi:hypothetical protein